MTASNEKNTATLLHLSTLSQYFIPFGNYIFPIIIWSAKKNDSEFVDKNGKQVLNFQLSMFLYTLVLLLISVPILIYTVFKNVPLHGNFNDGDFVIDSISEGNISAIVILALVSLTVFSFLKIFEFILIICGAVKASNGIPYRYPLSISFFS